MTDDKAAHLPETWVARVGRVFLIVRAWSDDQWMWEIMRERWFNRSQTLAHGFVNGPLDEAQRVVAREAELRMLLASAKEPRGG